MIALASSSCSTAKPCSYQIDGLGLLDQRDNDPGKGPSLLGKLIGRFVILIKTQSILLLNIGKTGDSTMPPMNHRGLKCKSKATGYVERLTAGVQAKARLGERRGLGHLSNPWRGV